MKPHQPRISVIMATLNSASFVSDALSSVARQTYPAHEIIVVDGGSTDGTLDLVAATDGVRLLPQEGAGLANAWNQGIHSATGSHIAWLDSDDYWEEWALAAHVLAHRSHSVNASSGRVRFFLDSDTVPRGFRSSLLNGDHPAQMPGTTLVTRELARQVGDFREDLGVSTDIAWFAALRRLEPPQQVDRVVLHKRVHGGNLSTAALGQDSYAATIVKALRGHLSNDSTGSQANR